MKEIRDAYTEFTESRSGLFEVTPDWLARVIGVRAKDDPCADEGRLWLEAWISVNLRHWTDNLRHLASTDC